MSEDKWSWLRSFEWIIVLLLMIPASFLVGSQHGSRKALKEAEHKTDTIKTVVSVYKDFPEPVKTVSAGMIPIPRYLFFSDSIEVEVQVPGPTQYIYLPREQKYYEEEGGKLRLWVSGYDPSLDRYEADWTTTTIIDTYRPKQKHWGAGVSGGYGMTVFEGMAIHGPSASVFGFYNFNSFGLGVSGELNTAAYHGGLLATPSVRVFSFFSW